MEVNKLDELVRQYFDPDKLPPKAYQLFLEDMAGRASPAVPLMEAERVETPYVEGGDKRPARGGPIPTPQFVTYSSTYHRGMYRWAFTASATDLVVTVFHPPVEAEVRYNLQERLVTYLYGTEGGRRFTFPKVNSQKRIVAYDRVEMPPGRYYLVGQGDNSLTFKHESKF